MKKKTIAAIIAVIAFSAIVVQGAVALSIEDGLPPDGKVGQLYFYQLKAREGSGTPPLT